MQVTNQLPGRPGVNARLSRFKREGASTHPTGEAASSLCDNTRVRCLTSPSADRKQTSANDGRMCTTAPTLSVKTTHSSYVSHVEDGPFNFTIQLKSTVEELLPKLRHILARHPSAPITSQLIPGSIVMAKSRDEVLKRAVIMNVGASSCKVYYIDFGSADELPYEDVFQLPEAAAELSPAMAMQFCLTGLKSVEVSDANKEYFARLLLGKQVLIRVSDKETNSPIQYCEMFWEGRSVCEILLNLNSPMQYSYQYAPRGREIPVSVIFVNGPTQFFVQYQSDIHVVHKIQETLAAYCPSVPRVTGLSAINIGSPVAALFEDDQQWYRALVMGMNIDASTVNVFYVDYGNRGDVGPDQLCALNRELVNDWKTQAVECCLIGFDTVSSDVYLSGKMEEIVLGHVFTLVLHSILSGFRLSVDLIDDQGYSVATKMRNVLDERQKPQVQEPIAESENAPYHEDDRSSQQSSCDSGSTRNRFIRPTKRADQLGKGGDQQRNSRRPYIDQGTLEFYSTNKAEGIKQWETNNFEEVKPFPKKDSWESKPDGKTDWRRSEDSKAQKGFFKRSERSRFNAAAVDRVDSNSRLSTERPILAGCERSMEPEMEKRGKSHKTFETGDWNKASDIRGPERGSKFLDRPNWDNRNRRLDIENSDRKFGGMRNRNSLPITHQYPDGTWSNTENVEKQSGVINEYKYQQFNVGEDYKVFFLEMESLSTVYVRLADSGDELEKIRQLIADGESAVGGHRPITSAVMAMPILAKFQEDGLLYRAIVRSIAKSHAGQVDILFVDFGNTATVSMNEAFAIPPELMTIPVQAVRVLLTDMQHMHAANSEVCLNNLLGESLSLRPSRTSTINLELVVEGVLIRSGGVSIVEATEEASTQKQENIENYAVVEQLTRSSGDGQIAGAIPLHPAPWLESLDLLLGQCLLAKVVTVVTRDAYVVKITATLDLAVLAQSDSPLNAELTAGCDIIISVFNKGQDRLIVKFYDRMGNSMVGGNSRCPICPAPIVNRSGTFTIPHIEDDVIYLQMETDDQMANFLELLFDVYDTSVEDDAATFITGKLCVAKSHDNNWYRARIIEVVDDVYKVRFIDYGNTEEISGADKLRDIQSKFLCPEKCIRVVLPLKYIDLCGCLKTIGGSVQCTFIKWNLDRGAWLVDLYRPDTLGNFALEWIMCRLAAAIDDDVPVDPRRREPGWNLKRGDDTAIVVSHADSPSQFWVQLSSQLTDIEELQTALQTLPDAEEGSDLGTLFASKYAEDLLWYRAISFETRDRFIDYGNTDIAVERKPLPSTLNHPKSGYALAFELNVQPIHSSWSDEAVKMFDAFIDEDLTAEIKSVDYKITVDLKSGDKRLSSCLVEAGHAKYIKPNSISMTVPEDEVPAGLMAGTVSVFTSMYDFYIHDNSRTNMMQYLNQSLAQADDFEVLATPIMGQYVIARFCDDAMWYRAQVVSEDPLAVLFLDYGNTAVATEFRVMPTEVASIPLMTWRCTVHVGDSTEVSEWFAELVNSCTVFDVTFIGKKGPQHVVMLGIEGVPLFKSENEVKISAHLVRDERNSEDTNYGFNGERTVIHQQEIAIQGERSKAPLTSSITKPNPLRITKQFYKNCVLVHSNGPYDFYVQTDEDHILIEEMANALFEGDSFPTLDKVEVGDFVVAQFPEDDAHYRAIVTALQPEILVHFVDQGNTCPAFSFHELPSKLKEIPRLAMRCSLESPCGGWSVDAIDIFTSMLLLNRKSFDVRIIAEGDPNTVDVEIGNSSLIDKLSIKTVHTGVCNVTAASSTGIYIRDTASSEELARIAEQLRCVNTDGPSLQAVTVGKVVAVIIDGILRRGRVEQLNPTCVFLIDTGLSAEVGSVFELPELVSAAPGLARQVSIDWGRDAELTGEGYNELIRVTASGAQYKLSTAKSTVELVVDGNHVADLLDSYLVPSPASPSIAHDEEFLPVTVSFLNSPSDFFYQLNPEVVTELGARLASADNLTPVKQCEIQVGDLVAAKWSEDLLWYRVKITATEPSVKAFFIDYGYFSERIFELKGLPIDLVQLPPLCLKGSLEVQQESWTEEQTIKFRKIISANEMSCSVVEKTPEKLILKMKAINVPDMVDYLKRID